MRFLRFNDNRTGLLVEGPDGLTVIDLLAASSILAQAAADDGRPLGDELADLERTGWRTLIERWDQLKPALSSLVERARSEPDGLPGATLPLEQVRVRPPLPS